MVDISDLLYNASQVDEGSLQIQRFIVKGKTENLNLLTKFLRNESDLISCNTKIVSS